MHFRVKNILKNNRNHTFKHLNIPLNKNSFSFSTHISKTFLIVMLLTYIYMKHFQKLNILILIRRYFVNH